MDAPQDKGRVDVLSLLDEVLAGHAAEPARAAPSTGPAKVLVADDNDDYRGIVVYLLKKAGCAVTEAHTGREALELARKATPDLIVIDLAMPEMNGYEVIGELRARPETMQVPVIVLTGATNRERLREILEHVRVNAFLAKPVKNTDLLEAVRAVLGARVTVDQGEPAQVVAPPEKEEALAVEALLEEHEKAAADAEQVPAQEPDDSPIIAQVSRILSQAVQKGASDIHIEPFETELAVRFRMNGALAKVVALPTAVSARLAARIKVMSNLSLTEKRRPQDGRLRARIGGKKVEFRVSTIPGVYGEKIVMRVLGGAQVKERLDLLGFSARDLDCVRSALNCPHGLVLVTGPTGSGKSTTLYTMVRHLAKPEVNVVTVEDPVEAELPGVTQMAVRPDLGVTFETALRAFLRQDPDVMLVGEIRDLDTAQIAVKASITGHLVLSTLHTNSAPATALRLIHMGVPGFLVASSLKVVVAQRLVRTLCPKCKRQEPAPEADLKALSADEKVKLATVWTADGCDGCHKTGCAGRRPLFEVMPIASPEMKRLLTDGRDPEAIAALAAAEGMSTLRQGALDLAAAGEISLPEAMKLALGD